MTERPKGRWLAKQHPCVGCATPVWVRTLRDVPEALCKRCGERKRLAFGASSLVQRAMSIYEQHRAQHEEWLDIARWMAEAAGLALEGSARLLAAAMLNDVPSQRARWVRIACSWQRWALSLMEQVEAPLRNSTPPVLELVRDA